MILFLKVSNVFRDDLSNYQNKPIAVNYNQYINVWTPLFKHTINQIIALI